jgi:hypothetical protein
MITYFQKKATGKYLGASAAQGESRESYPAVWQENASGWVKLPPSGRQKEGGKARVMRELDVTSPFMSHGEREEEERLRHRFSKVLPALALHRV